MDLQSPRPVTTVRRNPPRKAKQTPSSHVIGSSDNTRAAVGITPFPLDKILEPEPPQNHSLPNQKPFRSSSEISSNLRVFLRICPIECRAIKGSSFPEGETRAPGKGRVSKEGERDNRACLFVNSSSSVTLNAPPAVLDSKRAKSEVYDGFSHVFPPESLQENIYDKVMQPLVMDFLEGHSSLLVAIGPTGSGKTYTMFGSSQQLGIVPLALRQILSQKAENGNIQASRTYYISMFEIHSERGKGEKIFDLSPESMPHQPASISSLKEVKISSVADAEKIVAHGIFKRSTASTNANNQSSRSQCIVNVRCLVKSDTDGHSLSSAVLTIADLAGAERERKTGNQGARLLESNFINNTSMVFGQCLRSLLEHQKNPKKPIEKHFKNSLLTRYLQDYMEGKKRMTLILTVKAAQEDYMDASFILRQASPYMKIKFSHLQESTNAQCQKRKAALIRTERSKKRKVNISEASLIDVDHVVIDATTTSQISEKVISESDGKECIGKQGNPELHVELQTIKRSEEVMRKFTRTFWSLLKQYKHKLKESENEVQCLKESLREKSAQVTELDQELKELRNSCSCLNTPVEECAKPLSSNNGVSVPPIPSDPDFLQNTDALPDANHTIPETFGKNEMDRDAKTLNESLFDTITTGDRDELSLQVHQSTLQQVEISGETFSCLPLEENDKEFLTEKPECLQELTQSYVQVGGMVDFVMDLSNFTSFTGPHDNVPVIIPVNENEFNEKTSNAPYCFPQSTVPLEGEGCISRLPGNEETSTLQAEKEQPELKVALSENVPRSTSSHETEALKGEEDDPALRPLNSKKPKRKLLPASTILLKDFNGLVMDENAMEVKRKKTANTKGRSEGSISLIRILKSNLPR